MKTFTLLKTGLWAIGFTLTTGIAIGQTAVQSGNWSDPATWGGTAPAFSLGNNTTVEIPDGITVTLNNTVIVDGPGVLGIGGASLEIEGILNSAGAGDLILTAGTIIGDGDITVEDFIFNGGNFNFTGEINAKNVTSVGTLPLGATLTVEDMFTLSSGAFNVINGGSFTLAEDAEVMINSGTMNIAGGTVNLTNSYNLTYTQGSSITGFEIDGPGLNNVTINVGAVNSVTLSSDLDVNGILTLDEGDLILNGNDLTINGTLAASTNGEIISTDESNISINSTTGIGGVLYFGTAGNEVDDFTVNVGEGNILAIGSDLVVHGVLNLTGGHINIDDNDLEIRPTGTINGADSSSYIITTIDGSLGMTLSGGGSTFMNFPVGTSTNYMPVGIQFNSGSSTGVIRVGVNEGVLAEGTSGNDLADAQPVINGTWFIEPALNITNLSTNIRFMWDAGLEVNGFDRSAAYVAHYTSSDWEMTNSIAAATESNGMYMLTATNVTAFSPFAIFGENAISGIDEVAANLLFDVYPNPTAERINIDFKGDVTGIINMDIVDIQGRIMSNYKLTGNETSIAVDHLPAGNYFVRLNGDNFNAVKKIVKL